MAVTKDKGAPVESGDVYWVAHGKRGKEDPFRPNLGYFYGMQGDIIDWLDLKYPGFREDLTNRDASLNEIAVLHVTADHNKAIKEAKLGLQRSEELLEAALDPSSMRL